ncbi:hypothetical protein [Pseudoalteromonas obscura]|uniref:Uncharacterized protein n=1 Tax=Pseudoalteromonas obscura TaxID=3048491 RepID=A0ABT7EPD7_9GAMM|nr:hypothetical protein [Pseudoalteromonas sp. P94(2023)]MDK2596919.1 hypothetical protein [Pseudoalteromonas sp. P94(2023)]
MEEVYRAIKRAGHDLIKLADIAKYSDNDSYQKVKEELGTYSVFIRYSLDAYENFLPSCIGFEKGKYDYSATMTNHAWMIEMRDLLASLIAQTSEEFTGLVEFDFEDLYGDAEKMREFAVKVGVVKS